MAIDPIVVQRYAQALFQRALDEGALELLAQEVIEILPALRGNERLRDFFESPNIPKRAKRALIERTLAATEASQLDEFAHLLLDRGRIDHFVPCLDLFITLEEEHRGFFNAEVVTAVELSQERRVEMLEVLERHTGHQLDLTFTIDPRILGGVVFRHRDELIDTSLRTGLAEIGAELKDVRVH
ncbi:ATP synthase F1 subunit delta [Candidatus Sumerlaeota bacterium]|nr:ATP synthase F1 subunit delta [Candidatus Sumerlaeota bacterium]